MSDLQLALLALGIVIIVAVIFYNWWQERNIQLEAENRFGAPGHDVLMDEMPAAQEPVALTTNPLSEPARPAAEDAFDDDEFYEQPLPSTSSSVEVPPYTAQPDAPAYRERIEPTFSDDWMRDDLEETATEKIATASNTPSRLETPVATTPAADKLLSASEQSEEQPSLPDGVNQQIDLIALLYLSQSASGLMLREYLLSLADIDKPIYAYGLDSDGIWRLLTREQESGQFSRVICSVQLADRSGPISKATLGRFQQAVDIMGAQLAAQIEWLGSADPLRYASELDQFCMEVDKLVGFHLVQGESGPFTGTKLRGLAEASGMVLHEDGSFHHESEHMHQAFSMVNQDNNPFSVEMLRTSVIRGVIFQLDIPRVRNCLEVFNQMVFMARKMEGSLNGRLVDDNQRQLGDTQIEKIRQQLKMIHAKMVTRGIVPGSDNALRLFS